MTRDEARGELVRLLNSGSLDLPSIGGGNTAGRWQGLFELALDHDVSVARLAEAHVDAVGILCEAGLRPEPGRTYAVWASVGPGGSDVALDGSTISGTKPFCSGIGIVDRALVDVTTEAGRQLVEVDLTSCGGWTQGGSWGTVALSATATLDVHFARQRVERTVGPVGWYLSRPGFWHGACGPAACWAGAAAGLVSRRQPAENELALSRFGSLLTEVFVLQAVLEQAGRRIDDRLDDVTEGRMIALAARSAVHDSCLRLTEQFARLFGPRALVDTNTAQRYADVLLYVRQFHPDTDPIALAETVGERS